MNPTEASNHRACSRTPLDLDVALFYSDKPALYGKLLDISFGGALVEIDSVPLKVNDPVTIDVFLQEDERDEHIYSLSAVVIRKPPEGAGLKFDDYDGDTIKSLRRLYQHALT